MASPEKILIRVEPEYEDLEVWCPRLRLQEAGFDVKLLGRPESRPGPA